MTAVLEAATHLHPTKRPRPDVGRLLFTPLCTVLLADNVHVLASHTLTDGRRSWLMSAQPTVSGLLIVAFYAFTIWAYLRRPTARASSSSVAANAAALLATVLPLTMPLVHTRTAAPAEAAIGGALLCGGLGWSVWAVRTLGTSLSVIPQARSIVRDGPYRLVRHPLYLGEIVSTLGLVTLRPASLTACLWLTLCALQAFRAGNEERILASTFVDYADYRTHTRRIVPGLY